MYNPKQFIAGLVTGLSAPALVIYVFYLVKFSDSSFLSFLETSISKHIASPLLALSLLINMGLFFLFLKFDRLWAGRGVILATFLYGIIMLYVKMGL